jgi:hypothetical protein
LPGKETTVTEAEFLVMMPHTKPILFQRSEKIPVENEHGSQGEKRFWLDEDHTTAYSPIKLFFCGDDVR